MGVEHPRGGRAAIKHGRQSEVHLVEVPPEARAAVIKAYLARAIDARPHFPVAWDAPIEAFERIASTYPVFRIEAGACWRRDSLTTDWRDSVEADRLDSLITE